MDEKNLEKIELVVNGEKVVVCGTRNEKGEFYLQGEIKMGKNVFAFKDGQLDGTSILGNKKMEFSKGNLSNIKKI